MTIADNVGTVTEESFLQRPSPKDGPARTADGHADHATALALAIHAAARVPPGHGLSRDPPPPA